MNWLDITLLCLAGIGFVKGLFDGVIKQVVSLIALLVGLFFLYEGGTLAAWIYIGIGLVSRTRSDGAQLRGGFPVDRGCHIAGR